MSDFRILLLILGALVLVAVYFLSKPRKPRQARGREGLPESAGERDPALDIGALRTRLPEDEPKQETLSLELERLGQLISRERSDERLPATKPAQPEASPTETAPARKAAPERIIAVYVRTRGTDQISGRQIQDGAQKAGLEYGHMDIYHRLDEAGSREAIFSLANMTPPGTLDQVPSPDFTTPGVALFLQLPGPVSGLNALDAMLAAARRLSELWGAELLDESHSTLTRQRIQQLREEMRDYDRRQTIDINGPVTE